MSVDCSARPLLTPELSGALLYLLPWLRAHARNSAVEMVSLEISGYVDPEEGWSKIVVTQEVELPLEQAMDYWAELRRSMRSWLNGILPEIASAIRARIAVEVETADGR